MRRTFPLLIVSLVLLFAACDDKITTSVPTLEVNVSNLDGTWKLAHWNESPLADSTYLYIALNRKNQTFRIYDNLNTMYPRLVTGSFELEKDPKVGDIISGTYDYEGGAWNHEYLINYLYETCMTWTAVDDASDVQHFVRVAEVPSYIVEAVREVEN